jgi:hypothetical protein
MFATQEEDLMARHRLALLVSAAAIAFVILAALAPAHIKRFQTNFASISATEGSRSTVVELSGVVASPRQGCVRNREVRGGSFNPESGLTSGIRETTTSNNGSFSLETSRRGNTYKVEVSRKRLRSRRGHRHICKRRTVTIERT